MKQQEQHSDVYPRITLRSWVISVQGEGSERRNILVRSDRLPSRSSLSAIGFSPTFFNFIEFDRPKMEPATVIIDYIESPHGNVQLVNNPIAYHDYPPQNKEGDYYLIVGHKLGARYHQYLSAYPFTGDSAKFAALGDIPEAHFSKKPFVVVGMDIDLTSYAINPLLKYKALIAPGAGGYDYLEPDPTAKSQNFPSHPGVHADFSVFEHNAYFSVLEHLYKLKDQKQMRDLLNVYLLDIKREFVALREVAQRYTQFVGKLIEHYVQQGHKKRATQLMLSLQKIYHAIHKQHTGLLSEFHFPSSNADSAVIAEMELRLYNEMCAGRRHEIPLELVKHATQCLNKAVHAADKSTLGRVYYQALLFLASLNKEMAENSLFVQTFMEAIDQADETSLITLREACRSHPPCICDAKIESMISELATKKHFTLRKPAKFVSSSSILQQLEGLRYPTPKRPSNGTLAQLNISAMEKDADDYTDPAEHEFKGLLTGYDADYSPELERAGEEADYNPVAGKEEFGSC